MKPLVVSAVALGVTTAITGWSDPTAAEEPFELDTAQLDRITAGTDIPTENVSLNFVKILPPQNGDTWELSLRVDSPGTGSGGNFTHTFTFGVDSPR